MTDEERTSIVLRLIAMQNTLRTIIEHTEEGARAAEAADGKGLAFATLMLKEALVEYGRELNKFVLGSIGDDKP